MKQYAFIAFIMKDTMDLFDNPVGYLTSPAVFQAKARL
jgi:hypothetical protein